MSLLCVQGLRLKIESRNVRGNGHYHCIAYTGLMTVKFLDTSAVPSGNIYSTNLLEL